MHSVSPATWVVSEHVLHETDFLCVYYSLTKPESDFHLLISILHLSFE